MQITNWRMDLHDGRISNNLIKKCLLGLDILTILPNTKDLMSNLKDQLDNCSQKEPTADDVKKGFLIKLQQNLYKI